CDALDAADGDASLRLRLVHTPDRFAAACAAGEHLVLAGHNHGGQVCCPGVGPLLCPSRHGVRYAAGTFRRGGTVMHVGRGTGSLFPLRYACPPELAFITLVTR
ncbi:MAG: metallophosphoesterase, partial [Planctomycetota bacterium]